MPPIFPITNSLNTAKAGFVQSFNIHKSAPIEGYPFVKSPTTSESLKNIIPMLPEINLGALSFVEYLKNNLASIPKEKKNSLLSVLQNSQFMSDLLKHSKPNLSTKEEQSDILEKTKEFYTLMKEAQEIESEKDLRWKMLLTINAFADIIPIQKLVQMMQNNPATFPDHEKITKELFGTYSLDYDTEDDYATIFSEDNDATILSEEESQSEKCKNRIERRNGNYQLFSDDEMEECNINSVISSPITSSATNAHEFTPEECSNFLAAQQAGLILSDEQIDNCIKTLSEKYTEPLPTEELEKIFEELMRYCNSVDFKNENCPFDPLNLEYENDEAPLQLSTKMTSNATPSKSSSVEPTSSKAALGRS